MVPERKKGFGAGSLILFNPLLTKLILCPDLEKSEPRNPRVCIPGGTRDPRKDRNLIDTAIREGDEEAGLLFTEAELFEIAYHKTFAEGEGGASYHKFFVGFVDERTLLRTIGFSEEINGVMTQVVGPPEWWMIDDALRQSSRSSGMIMLHKSHQRALCEALIELGEKNRTATGDEHFAVVEKMYKQREEALREMQRQFQSDEAYYRR